MLYYAYNNNFLNVRLILITWLMLGTWSFKVIEFWANREPVYNSISD